MCALSRLEVTSIARSRRCPSRVIGGGYPMKGVELSVMVALGAGLLSFLSPCVLPLVPSYLSFIAGVSFDDFKRTQSDSKLLRKVVLNSLLFIVGFSTVFMTLGLSFSLVGQVLIQYQEAIRMVAGLLIAFFGVYISGALEHLAKVADVAEKQWGEQPVLGLIPIICRPLLVGRYLTRSLQFHIGNRPAGYVGAILVGVSFAVGWTPCVGPILGAILALASSTAHITSGLLLLGAYSVGLGIPFLLSAVAINSFFHFFSKFKRYIELVHIGGGLLLILVGTLIFTGYLTVLNSIAIQFTPAWLWERL
jgi:cytochrome c-type biogenesis protein